jgi:isopenicillin-N N-acyltransferase-like protein
VEIGLGSRPVPPEPIPVLHVRGSHREVGRRIGEACAATIAEAVAFPEVPARTTIDAQLSLAERFREATARAMPWVLEELDGCAEGAGVDPLRLFAASVEEIWGTGGPREDAPGLPASDAARGRCSDLVAVPPATAGHVLVAHNNDLSPSAEAGIVAIEWDVPGDPLVFTIGVGPWISVGFNASGLSLTGNELTPNDDRVGVPRLLQVRAMLRAPTLDAALAEALRPDRASSYNNVLCWRDGRAANVEGSATDAEVTTPDPSGTLAHTNHYVCERMLGYEGDPAYARRSEVRYRRAVELLGAAASAPGSVTEEALRGMLSDHANAPDSLCRHPRDGTGSKTVFSVVAVSSKNRVAFGRGNPCDSTAQTYSFA